MTKIERLARQEWAATRRAVTRRAHASAFSDYRFQRRAPGGEWEDVE